MPIRWAAHVKLRTLLFAVALGCSGASKIATVVVEASSPAISDGTLVESVGIETLGGVFTSLLQAGCTLPCEVTNTFSTAADNQSEISIALVRGTAELAAENHSLGRFAVIDIPAAPRGEPQVAITLRASGNSIALAARELSGSPIQLVREAAQGAAQQGVEPDVE